MSKENQVTTTKQQKYKKKAEKRISHIIKKTKEGCGKWLMTNT